ncbi:GSCFA domain-containing protein [Falsiroseomonas ponticola]|uniref:GSCFA domain-containing protein n=1 Tax=Falsiroseomonas ponticola TaxID=2786951 RepID=UPI001931B26F|nr:GSCFA domain-containing protein [Roseomonas ponticola]
MSSPYDALPARHFWRNAVAGAAAGAIPDLFHPRFPITKLSNIATAGSCFAQHIGRYLRSLGYNVLDVEPAPPGLTGDAAKRYGFDLYSARHGNIYTTLQLLQLIKEAMGSFRPGDAVWSRNGRYYDALRPTVEPNGLARAESVRAHRAKHLQNYRKLLEGTDLLVFTMGLVEAWMHAPSGTVFPTAPGVVADSSVPSEYVLKSFNYNEITGHLLEIYEILRRIRPDIRILLTVSPVPLTATATDDHVLVATTHAKAVLRAVAGQLKADHPAFDYFPSFELISTHTNRGRWYAPNMREVTSDGVGYVMRHFSEGYGEVAAQPALPAAPALPELDADEAAEAVICDEMLLESFDRSYAQAS